MHRIVLCVLAGMVMGGCLVDDETATDDMALVREFRPVGGNQGAPVLDLDVLDLDQLEGEPCVPMLRPVGTATRQGDVENGLSCLNCHATTGSLTKADIIRLRIGRQP